MDLRQIQELAWANKLAKGFNTWNVPKEFMLLVEEVGEASKAWRKGEPHLGEELADIGIFLAGIARMTGYDLQEEMEAKLQKNALREYEALPNGTLAKREPELGE